MLELFDVADADARANEPLLKNGRIVGLATSGGYGWRVGKSPALGMASPELAQVGAEVDIAVPGKTHRAMVVGESPFDPDNARSRG